MLDIQKSMLYFLRFPMFVDMVFYLKVELHAFPSEMKIEHTVNMKTGNIKIRWLECQFYVKKLSSLTFSFCSTAKDWHLESALQVPSSRHSWAWLVTSEEISNESSSPIWHLLTGFPSLGVSSCGFQRQTICSCLAASIHICLYLLFQNIYSPLAPSTFTKMNS